MNISRITIKALCFLFALSLAACDGGTASCKETCEDDDECESGLACFALSGGEKECLPEECSACFDNGRTCYHSENVAEQAEGEDRVCEFSECG